MVKCADCGFLGVRAIWTVSEGNFPTAGQVGEMWHVSRTQGAMEYPSNALCLAGVIEFPLGISKSHTGLLAIVQEERECSEFTPWRQGFTPKEHREMLDRKWMIEREDRRDQEMRAREDRRDQELRRLQERLHSRELWIMGGAVTIALIVSGVIAAVIEGAVSRGWQPPWWPF